MSDLQKRPRFRSTGRTQLFSAAALIGVLLVTGVVVSVDQAANSSGNIRAFCVNKKTEKVSFRKTCKANEKRFSYAKSGKSAYQTWLDLGNSGTEQDFINSLKGSNGSAVRSFATSCYQKLMDAESAGYLWTNSSDRSRFERMTGCTVSEIDINPFSYLLPSQPIQIVDADFIGLWGGAGGGEGITPDFSYEFGGGGALYEVKYRNDSDLLLCGTADSVVLESPVSGKSYILGDLFTSSLESILSLSFGVGNLASGELSGEEEIQVGDYYLNFSTWVERIPQSSVSTFVLDSITYGSERTPVDSSNFTLSISPSQSTKISGLGEFDVSSLPQEFSFSSTEALGIQRLHFVLEGNSFSESFRFEGYEQLSIGVDYCLDGRGSYYYSDWQDGLHNADVSPFNYKVNIPRPTGDSVSIVRKREFLIQEGFIRFVNALGL